MPPSAPEETDKGKGKREKRPAPSLDPAAPAPTGENLGQRNRAERKGQRLDAQPSSGTGAAAVPAPSRDVPKEQQHKGEREMRQAPPQQMAPSSGQAAPPQGGGKPEKGKKDKKGEEEPAPSPGQ